MLKKKKTFLHLLGVNTEVRSKYLKYRSQKSGKWDWRLHSKFKNTYCTGRSDRQGTGF